jgi:hypothetical protein
VCGLKLSFATQNTNSFFSLLCSMHRSTVLVVTTAVLVLCVAAASTTDATTARVLNRLTARTGAQYSLPLHRLTVDGAFRLTWRKNKPLKPIEQIANLVSRIGPNETKKLKMVLGSTTVVSRINVLLGGMYIYVYVVYMMSHHSRRRNEKKTAKI